MKITSAQMNTPSWCLNTEKYEAVQIPPTPWYVGEMNDNGIRVAPVADPRNAVAYAFDEDTAAFIVRACNSHDTLVEALRGMLSIEESVTQGQERERRAEWLPKARAALRAAAPSQANSEGEK